MEKEKRVSKFTCFMIAVVTALITCLITAVVVFSCMVMNNDSQLTPVGQENNTVGNIFLKLISNLPGKKTTDKSLHSKMTEIKSKLDEIYILRVDNLNFTEVVKRCCVNRGEDL